MKQPIDLARRFLTLADNDVKAFRKLAEDDDIADATVGFHAQQAVEKCLKTVLALHNVKFQKKHDLNVLLDLFIEHGMPQPPMADVLDELTPYAVTMRYDFVDVEVLDRKRTEEIVEAVQRWAENEIKTGA